MSGGSRVFIGRLSPHARERDVEKFFKGYGRIREINLKNGFGFVEFDDHRDADDAVYELNGKELCSERVTIEHARSRRGRGGGPGMGRFGGSSGGGYRPSRSSGSRPDRYGPPVRTDHRLIVENLSSRISWQVRDHYTFLCTLQHRLFFKYKKQIISLCNYMFCFVFLIKQHSFD